MLSNTVGSKSLKMVKYWIFFVNFLKSLINKDPCRNRIRNSEIIDPDLGGKKIIDPPDPDQQHWKRTDFHVNTWTRGFRIQGSNRHQNPDPDT
jgi:hypothetical protein